MVAGEEVDGTVGRDGGAPVGWPLEAELPAAWDATALRGCPAGIPAEVPRLNPRPPTTSEPAATEATEISRLLAIVALALDRSRRRSSRSASANNRRVSGS